MATHWSARHPRATVMYFWLETGDDPFERVDYLLSKIPNGWPKDGWRMAPEDLTCPFGCGAGNRPYSTNQLIELHRDRSGSLTIMCSCCGKHAPCVLDASGLPVLSSGLKGPN